MRAFLILLLLASPAAAQSLPVIAPSGPPLEAVSGFGSDRQWQAVGRVETGPGFCTGTLIAADLVLTAAHCMFDPETGAPLSLAGFGFNAGLRNGRPVAYRGVRRAVIHPDYAPDLPDELDQVRTDIAILELDRAIPAQTVRPIPARGRAGIGDSVQIVSYGRDRADYASLEDGCEMRAGQGGLQILACHIDPGSSGAPVFMRQNGQLGIVSVISAFAEWQDDPVALAADLGGGLAPILDLLDRTDDVFSREASRVRTLTAGNDGTADIAARFIRVSP